MNHLKELEEKRKQILKEMGAIRFMRKGSVSQQYLKVRQKGQSEPALRGPYYVYTYKDKGKTVSKRLSQTEALRVKDEVNAHHRFQELCSELSEISERLCEYERASEEGSVEKKPRSSPSRSLRR